jgi:glycosyltransferase involved in cell wall biosynthesis
VGFVPDDLRDDALAAAVAYVQPSTMESFSRTVMESWLAGTPVLANAKSEVVAWHIGRCGGGRTFSDGRTLAAEVAALGTGEGDVAQEMARAGRRYVLENYTWPVVLDRMEASLQTVLGAS